MVDSAICTRLYDVRDMTARESVRNALRGVPPGGATLADLATLIERVVAPIAVSLPVRQGQVLGQVQIWDGAKLIGRRPLVASRTVPAPGVAGRAGWYARRTVHHVVGLFT